MDKNFDSLIKTVYRKFLFREPDPEGYAHFSNLLESKQIDENQFIHTIKNSDEFKRKQKAEEFNKQKKFIFTGDYELKYIIHPNSVLDFLLTQNGVGDKHMLREIKNLVSPNGIIFDVGANAGFLSIPLAKDVVPNGEVYSFEPDIDLYDHLCKNIELNNLQNIHVEKLAMQDDPSLKTAKLCKRRAIHDDGKTNYGLSTIQNNSEYVVGYESVLADTIDNFVISKNISSVDLIKIDVEGAEFKVLKGANATIMHFHPIIIYEFSREIDRLTTSKNTLKCFNYIKNHDYEQFIISNDKLNSMLNYDENLIDSDIVCVPK